MHKHKAYMIFLELNMNNDNDNDWSFEPGGARCGVQCTVNAHIEIE